MKKILLLIMLFLSGCAAVPPPRAEYTNLPPLEKGWSRVYFSAGYVGAFNIDAKFSTQTGPVYINDKEVGAPARDEYIAVDLMPGTYEAHWMPREPDKYCPIKAPITVKPGDLRYFACDMSVGGSAAFGLAGYAIADCATSGSIAERPLPPNSKLVSYFKVSTGSSTVDPSENAPVHHNADIAPSNTPTNESVSQKLRDLQALRKDGVISEEEFQKKKKELLNKF